MGAERIEENGVGNLLNFSETSHLFDYGFKNFSYRTILKKDEIVQEVTVSLSKTDYVTVHPADDVEVLFPRDLDPAELERVITLPDAADAPITAGQKLGTMELKDGDTVVFKYIPIRENPEFSMNWEITKKVYDEFIANQSTSKD